MDIRYGRKRSGIRRELAKKLEEWLDSIDNEAVRKAAKRDVIVTGGAIASMLLGEKVNDYDLYFRTKATTKLVAEYYVKKFIERNGSKNCVPKVIERTMTNLKGEDEERITIFLQSDGVVSEEEQDGFYDTVAEDEDVAEDDGKEPYRPVFMSQNAISLSNKIQVVIRFYGEPDEIHNNYDFVHATCYYDHHAGDLVMPAEALEALLSRTLIYRGSLYPVASIFRMKKFLERGWRITAGQQLKIMWQISEIDLTDMDTLYEQLTGVDMAYMWQLIDALKSAEPEKINSAYVSTIIDRIFE